MMEQLPDNVLVVVMQYLDIPDILRFRQLCTRLRDMTLLPDVWQHRTLPFSAPWACPVLRMAPCLHRIEARLKSTSNCHLAYISTRCAVEELHLSVADEPASVHSAALLLCRQEALGHLQKVIVFFDTIRNVSVLLSTLASTTGLKSLRMETPLSLSRATSTTTVLHCTVSAPSLRIFDSSLCTSSGFDPFVKAILAGHATTLEVVQLGCITNSTAALLSDMPNLRGLSCTCSIPGLEALAGSDSLRFLDLKIKTKSKYQAAAAGAAKLLQRAKYLREVTLEYSPPISSNTDVGADLVLALACPSGSFIQKLRIVNDNNSSFPQIYPLICALPRLPALRQLDLDEGVVPREYLLMAITPATAPSLELLAMSLSDGMCAHAWLHGQAVKTVMSAKPSLVIKLKCVTIYCAEDSCEDACVLSCHKGLSNNPQLGSGAKYLGIFSHGSKNKCLKDHIDKNRIWIHIP